MKKKICVVDTVYSLLLYLLYNPSWENDTEFYCGDTLPKEIREKLCFNVVKYPQSRIGRILFRFRFDIILKCLLAGEVYGQDHLPISQLFLKNGFILIEDGLANYCLDGIKKGNTFSFAGKYIYGLKQTKGLSKKVRKILLTGMQTIPESISKKVELIDIKSLVMKSDMDKIFSLFGVSRGILHENTILVLTQPLTESKKGLSVAQQLSIYKKVIEEYNPYNVVIKPHPRDICDYTSLGVNVLSPFFPVELLLFNKQSIDVLVTLWSSSAFHNSNVKRIEVLGTKDWPFLEEEFGHRPTQTIINHENL